MCSGCLSKSWKDGLKCLTTVVVVDYFSSCAHTTKYCIIITKLLEYCFSLYYVLTLLDIPYFISKWKTKSSFSNSHFFTFQFNVAVIGFKCPKKKTTWKFPWNDSIFNIWCLQNDKRYCMNWNQNCEIETLHFSSFDLVCKKSDIEKCHYSIFDFNGSKSNNEKPII